jgi:hypothetical protein
MSGYTLTQPELFYAQPANVTRSNYVTATQACMTALAATSVPRCRIPAGYFSTIGKCMHFEANGTIVGTASPTLALAAGLDAAGGIIAGTGGATLFTTPTYTPAATTTPWTAEFDLTAQAVGQAGTTLALNGEIDISNVASNASWTSSRTANMIAASVTGVDEELALYLELFATWTGTVSASDITVVQQFKVYLEN